MTQYTLPSEGLWLISATMKTSGFLLVLGGYEIGLALMVLSWYVLDFHYYQKYGH
jgi:hypothetical protein